RQSAIPNPQSQMYGRSMNRMRRLPDRFRHRRVRVDRADELFDGGFETKRNGRFGNQLGRAQADHVDTQQLVVLLIGHYLDEAFGLAGHFRAAQHAEREHADSHVVASLARLALGQSDAADLGIAIRAARNVIVVERSDVLARNPLGRDDPFGRRYVRQLRMTGRPERDDVADGRHTAYVRSVLSVDFYVALLDLKSGALGFQTGRDGTAARRDEEVVDTKRFFAAIGQLRLDFDEIVRGSRSRDLRPRVRRNPL